MTLDYLLAKRHIHLLDWLRQHDITSVEQFHTELKALGLEPATEQALTYIELLFKPIVVPEQETILPPPVTSKKKQQTHKE